MELSHSLPGNNRWNEIGWKTSERRANPKTPAGAIMRGAEEEEGGKKRVRLCLSTGVWVSQGAV